MAINIILQSIKGYMMSLKNEVNDLSDSIPDDIWSVDEIARYLKFSVTHTRNRVVTKVGFPRPIRHLKANRWQKKEIIEYFKK